MAPVQVSAAASAAVALPSRPSRPRPRLHLECRDLAHEGCQAFFEHIRRPARLLGEAVDAVLDALYPETLAADTTSASGAEVIIPPIRCITLYLRAFDGVAYTCSSDLDPAHKEIHLSASYLAGVAQRSASTPAHIGLEIRGVVTHEMVHVFQHNGKGTVPGGLIEGVADWVRDKAGLSAPHWRKTRPDDCDKWDQGYEKTGFFLSWLSERVKNPLLIPQMNLAMLHKEWEGGAVLKQLLGGADVERLFEEYRDSFSRGSPAEQSPSLPVPTHVSSA
ncbi:hypothetical protein JCM10908_000911 [Rhodotorula pacifica]|uniref:uncharacterized protein n=1 Tax=Rhodotorula pacifica TaxID=1495444 RepID=UPI0031782599